MKPIIALALAVALAATAGTAAAQPTPRPERAGKAATARPPTQPPRKVTSYDFEGDAIDGDRQRPDGTTVFGLTAARHGSLIRLRGDFVREIVRSSERL